MSLITLTGKDTIKLLRIPFSLLLMPVFLLAVSQVKDINAPIALVSFLVIHLLVYPASNGYNSYIDRDETSIGGLEHPPLPTSTLFYLTVYMDVAAIIISLLFIKPVFAFCVLLYILASRAYSAKQIRLKKYPFVGFLTVVVFQGGFTYFLASTGISATTIHVLQPDFFIMLACSFQIAGAYPLTQIYQHDADLKDGVVTLSYKLGYRGTFIFSGIMFLLCNAMYYLYFKSSAQEHHFYILQVFFLPIIVYFGWWFRMVIKDTSAANFKNTMRMSIIAACCMNSYFTFLILEKYTN